MSINPLDDFDEKSQEMLKSMKFIDMNTFYDMKNENRFIDPLESIRTTRSFEDISNEIAMEIPFGKKSMFYKLPDGSFVENNIDKKLLAQQIIKYTSSKSKLVYNLVRYNVGIISNFILDNEIIDVKTELNTLSGEIDFSRNPSFKFNFDIEKQKSEYKLFYEFVKFKNSANFNRVAIILTFYRYLDFNFFLSELNKELILTTQERIKKELKSAFILAKDKSEVLDFIYETAPDFALSERGDEYLFEDLILLSKQTINTWGTNENISIINLLKAIKNKQWFADKVNKNPDVIRGLLENFNDAYVNVLIDILVSIGNSVWTEIELENSIQFSLNSFDNDYDADNFIDSRIAYWCGYDKQEKKFEVGYSIHQYDKSNVPFKTIPQTLGFAAAYFPLKIQVEKEKKYIPTFIGEYITNLQLKEDKDIVLNDLVSMLLPEFRISTKAVSNLTKLFSGKKVQTVDELIEILNEIDSTVKATELENYGIEVLFRGTTRNAQGDLFLGNNNSIINGASTSTDPIRAVIFGIESSSKPGAKGVLQIFAPKNLKGLNLQAPQRGRFSLELEVIINTSPENLSNFAVKEIAIEDARKLVEEVYGISLDTRITTRGSADLWLAETKKLNPREALEFSKKLIKLKDANKVYKFVKPPIQTNDKK
ncbi:hypothetical protein [Flavobacterium sp.]|uniref:hypothetical protein n=1 Tax=Flavobacterium sp. TaxID=239 RepID=UPI00262947BE|nr:hypothetical protein [Flavobacterium sp.]